MVFMMNDHQMENNNPNPVPLYFGQSEIWRYSFPNISHKDPWHDSTMFSGHTQRSIHAKHTPSASIPESWESRNEEFREDEFEIHEIHPLILLALMEVFESTNWKLSDFDGQALSRLNSLDILGARMVISAIIRENPVNIRNLSKFTMSLCQNYGRLGLLQENPSIGSEDFIAFLDEFEKRGKIPRNGLDNRVQYELQQLGLEKARTVLERLPKIEDVKNINALIMTRTRNIRRRSKN